jgi:TfoX/Sxy family transcriptional regulator of competence genes
MECCVHRRGAGRDVSSGRRAGALQIEGKAMAYDPDLADRLRKVLNRRDGVSEKRMFGGICFLLHGNMLCGVETSRFMFRVGKAQQAKALAKPGASPMDFTGRPSGGMVWVEAEACEGRALSGWIRLAEDFVGQLPRK